MQSASCRAALRALTAMVILGGSSGTAAAASKSSEPAKQLVATMRGTGLDAIAARDPDAPDRFIAALVFPDSQLLVVSAPHPAPQALDQALAQGQYRDVYSALQQASIKDGKLFVQDLGCDGLQPGTDGTVDVVYQNVATQTIFDGNWKRQQLNEAEYQRRYQDVDERYSRMLGALLSAAQNATRPVAR